MYVFDGPGSCQVRHSKVVLWSIVSFRISSFVRWRRLKSLNRQKMCHANDHICSPSLISLAWLLLDITKHSKCTELKTFTKLIKLMVTPMKQVWVQLWLRTLYSCFAIMSLPLKMHSSPVPLVDGIVPLVEVTVDLCVHSISLSCDELTLSVCGACEDGALSLNFYDVRNFVNQVTMFE